MNNELKELLKAHTKCGTSNDDGQKEYLNKVWAFATCMPSECFASDDDRCREMLGQDRPC